MAESAFVYTIYIKTTADRLWQALAAPDLTQQYWFGMRLEAEWGAGAPWRLVFPDGQVADAGEVAEVAPPHRLVLRWRNQWKPEMRAEGDSLCTITLVPEEAVVKLTIAHEMARDGSVFIDAVSQGWPRILSNLKSLLETGETAFGAEYGSQVEQ